MPFLDSIDHFINTHMKKGSRAIPGRLQAALALLERLRTAPSLQITSHKSPNSSGLIGHERYGNEAHQRLGLVILNKNHGRRSCDIGGWGPDLLSILEQDGFEKASPQDRARWLDDAQDRIATAIRRIIEADPIEVSVKSRTAESVIREVLSQAEEKGKSGDVAQYLVGAKLMLRLGVELKVLAANRGDRKSREDHNSRAGDYEIENAIIEVALGSPDEKHLQQVAQIVDETDLQVWLLTRHDRVQAWSHELELLDLGNAMRRVSVASVEAFIGQNVSEMGGFSSKRMSDELQSLFNLYNERWVAQVGTPGIRIVAKQVPKQVRKTR